MTSGLCYPGDTTLSERIMQDLQHKMLGQVAAGKNLGTVEICNILAQTPLWRLRGNSRNIPFPIWLLYK